MGAAKCQAKTYQLHHATGRTHRVLSGQKVSTHHHHHPAPLSLVVKAPMRTLSARPIGIFYRSLNVCMCTLCLHQYVILMAIKDTSRAGAVKCLHAYNTHALEFECGSAGTSIKGQRTAASQCHLMNQLL